MLSNENELRCNTGIKVDYKPTFLNSPTKKKSQGLKFEERLGGQWILFLFKGKKVEQFGFIDI